MRLAERKKRLQLKRSMNSSAIIDNEDQDGRSHIADLNQNRPFTMKGAAPKGMMKGKFLQAFEEEEDMNELSMIKDNQMFGDSNYLDEASFVHDLNDMHLIKRLHEYEQKNSKLGFGFNVYSGQHFRQRGRLTELLLGG